MMFDRLSSRALFLVALALPIAGCTNQLVDTISVSPSAQSVGVGQTVQFTATGSVGHGSNHPTTTSDITTQVTWTSSSPSVATINSSGVATGVASGTTTITATINGYTGVLSASASLTVASSGSGGTGVVTGITSLAVIPGAQTVAAPGQTSQFIAIGTTASGSTIDITSQVAWSSSSVQIGTVVANSGLATAVGQGATTITALYSNPGGGNVVTGTAQFTVSGGTTEQFSAIQILPGSQSVSASGQTGQFIALATLGSNGLEEDVTNSAQLTWVSSIPTVATVTSNLPTGNGVVQGVSVGNTTITAELQNPNDGGVVTATATVSVTSTPAPSPLLSLQIIPQSISVINLQDTGNFLAIGTFSTYPYVQDLTNSVTWLSSAPDIFPVSSDAGIANPGAPGGVVTAYGDGSATIIAEYSDIAAGQTQPTIQTSTATFSCPLVLPNPPTTAGSCFEGSQAESLLATITVYNEGLNTTNWLVTAPSATNPNGPPVIHCGPGSATAGYGTSVCTASYPINATTQTPITLTATGGAFGGWSSSCNSISPDPSTTGPTNYCTVVLGPTGETITLPGTEGTYPIVNSNATVGAIFN
jgi:uncharacterized protein YjdB